MLWEDYLISKKIDSSQFKKNEADLWGTWQALFEQMHPKSFTSQKLYLINAVRRKYPYQEKADQNVKSKEGPAPLKRKPMKLKIVKAKPILKEPKKD